MSSGKIYRLVFPDGSYYIGSTVTSLASRLARHKFDCKRFDSKVYKKARDINWQGVRIEQFGNEIYQTEEELRITESMLIEESLNDSLCLNVRRPCVSKQEQEDAGRQRARNRYHTYSREQKDIINYRRRMRESKRE